MYGIGVFTPPATPPITVAELRQRLRLNDQGDDTDLTEFLAAAVDAFELDTSRPVLATTYLQSLARWPCGPIVLGRGGVTEVIAVAQGLADGSFADLDASLWRAELTTPPARVILASRPDEVLTDEGIAIAAGYVKFTAGWASAAAVPREVRIAIMLLAGHWYENREAWRDGKLEETPAGWSNIVSRYKLGISGPWGQ